MEKDIKKIAYNELLSEFKVNLENLQNEKEKLQIEHEKLKAEAIMYRKIMRYNTSYRSKYEDAYNRCKDFNYTNIDNEIEDAKTLVETLEEIMLLEI